MSDVLIHKWDDIMSDMHINIPLIHWMVVRVQLGPNCTSSRDWFCKKELLILKWYCFGTLLFPNANGKVDSRFLHLLENVDRVSSFAWGAAVLGDLMWMMVKKMMMLLILMVMMAILSLCWQGNPSKEQDLTTCCIFQTSWSAEPKTLGAIDIDWTLKSSPFQIHKGGGC